MVPTFIPKKIIALSLVSCLLLLSGMVVVSLPEHSLHHNSHHATTHGSLICSWLCTAGECVEGIHVALDYSHVPIAQFQPTSPAVHLSLITIEFPSRGPPQHFA